MAVDDLSRLSLAEIVALAEAQKRRPVEQWHPERCGDSAMRIARDGSWHHEGRPIARPELVRLFASILRREPDGSYALVTPAERLAIAVEDAPFVAVEMKCGGEGRARTLVFRLNTGELVVAGPDHPLKLDGARPYLAVRAGLDALIARPVYYELVELGLDDGGVWSGGAFFALGGGA